MQALKQALDFFNNKAPSHHIDLKQQQFYKQEYETFNKKLNKFMVASSATFAVGVLTGALFYVNAFPLFLALPLLGIGALAFLFGFGYILSTDEKQAMLKARLVPLANEEVIESIHLLLDQLLTLEKNNTFRQQILDMKQKNFLEYEEKFLMSFNQKMEQARNDYLVKLSSSSLNLKEEVVILEKEEPLFIEVLQEPKMRVKTQSFSDQKG